MFDPDRVHQFVSNYIKTNYNTEIGPSSQHNANGFHRGTARLNPHWGQKTRPKPVPGIKPSVDSLACGFSVPRGLRILGGVAQEDSVGQVAHGLEQRLVILRVSAIQVLIWLKPRAGHRRVLYRLLLTLSALEFVKVLGGKEVNIAAFGARLQELAKQVNVFGA